MRNKVLLLSIVVSGVLNAQPLLLVSGDDYKPYADSKLPEGGMTTELVKKAFAAVKKDVQVDWLPWKRGFEETREGKYAATFPYLKTSDREQDFLYSDVLVKIQDYPFVKSGAKNINFSKPETLVGTTLCLPLGWAPTPKLVAMVNNKSIKVDTPKDLSTCVKMVATGRADYFITDETQGQATVNSSAAAEGMVVRVNIAMAETNLYLIASKKSANSKDLLSTFNKGLDTLRKNGSYEKIIKAHSNTK